jgi:hypothetical protein
MVSLSLRWYRFRYGLRVVIGVLRGQLKRTQIPCGNDNKKDMTPLPGEACFGFLAVSFERQREQAVDERGVAESAGLP